MFKHQTKSRLKLVWNIDKRLQEIQILKLAACLQEIQILKLAACLQNINSCIKFTTRSYLKPFSNVQIMRFMCCLNMCCNVITLKMSILTFMKRINFVLSWVEYEKKLYNLGAKPGLDPKFQTVWHSKGMLEDISWKSSFEKVQQTTKKHTKYNQHVELTLRLLQKMHVKILSAEIVCCMQMRTSMTNFSIQANSVDSDETAPIWVHTVCYRDVLKEPADDI